MRQLPWGLRADSNDFLPSLSSGGRLPSSGLPTVPPLLNGPSPRHLAEPLPAFPSLPPLPRPPAPAARSPPPPPPSLDLQHDWEQAELISRLKLHSAAATAAQGPPRSHALQPSPLFSPALPHPLRFPVSFSPSLEAVLAAR